jgi:4'-phosphopantetheinyl transferase
MKIGICDDEPIIAKILIQLVEQSLDKMNIKAEIFSFLSGSKLIERVEDKVEKFYFTDDVKRCLSAGALLRYYLIVNHNIPNRNIKIGYNEYGKPYLLDFPNFQFNISHSGNWAICGFSKCSGNNSIMKIKELNLNELLSAFI